MSQIETYLEKAEPLQPAVVCYLVTDNKVLLGERYQSSMALGIGKVAGFGGKVRDTEETKKETDEEGLEREVLEETRVKIIDYHKVGRVRFLWPHKPKWNQDVTIYLVTKWEGEPEFVESMIPEWFDKDKLPKDRMWEDNLLWVPKVLAGNQVDMVFLYDENEHIIEVIDNLEPQTTS